MRPLLLTMDIVFEVFNVNINERHASRPGPGASGSFARPCCGRGIAKEIEEKELKLQRVAEDKSGSCRRRRNPDRYFRLLRLERSDAPFENLVEIDCMMCRRTRFFLFFNARNDLRNAHGLGFDAV